MFRSGCFRAFVVGLLLLLAGMSAHALIPKSYGYAGSVGTSSPLLSSCSAAVDRMISSYYAVQNPSRSYTAGACGTFSPNGDGRDYAVVSVTEKVIATGATTSFNSIVYRTAASACPANSAAVTGGCQCDTGFSENAAKTACEAPASDAEKFCKAMLGLTINTGGSGSIPPSSCHMPEPPFDAPEQGKGCGVSIGDAVKFANDEGKVVWSGVGKFLGGTCTPGATPEAPPVKSEADKCPGGFAGTVQGVEKCIPVEPDKGIEGVKTGSSTDANGTKKDVKEETKCEGQKCTTTTTTTTTTSSGTVTTSTATTTEAITDKCQKDPSNQVCQKTQGGQGRGVSDSSCQTNPSAKGCGGEGAPITGLYTGKDATVQGIMDQAVADLKGSGIGGAVGGFFTVSGGGSCPAMTWNVAYVNATVSLPNLCSEVASRIYVVLQGVLMVVAGFVAFRVAIDN